MTIEDSLNDQEAGREYASMIKGDLQRYYLLSDGDNLAALVEGLRRAKGFANKQAAPIHFVLPNITMFNCPLVMKAFRALGLELPAAKRGAVADYHGTRIKFVSLNERKTVRKGVYVGAISGNATLKFIEACAAGTGSTVVAVLHHKSAAFKDDIRDEDIWAEENKAIQLQLPNIIE